MKVVADVIIDIAITIVVDPVAGNLVLVFPDVVEQTGVVIVNSCVDDGDNHIVFWRQVIKGSADLGPMSKRAWWRLKFCKLSLSFGVCGDKDILVELCTQVLFVAKDHT